jgi:hypothetical protein
LAEQGSFWISALVGFIFMLFISPFFPVAGPIVGGIIGGYLGLPGAVRGALGGLLDGLIVAAIFSVIAVVGGRRSLVLSAHSSASGSPFFSFFSLSTSGSSAPSAVPSVER